MPQVRPLRQWQSILSAIDGATTRNRWPAGNVAVAMGMIARANLQRIDLRVLLALGLSLLLAACNNGGGPTY
jgi:hypothetical protein